MYSTNTSMATVRGRPNRRGSRLIGLITSGVSPVGAMALRTASADALNPATKQRAFRMRTGISTVLPRTWWVAGTATP